MYRCFTVIVCSTKCTHLTATYIQLLILEHISNNMIYVVTAKPVCVCKDSHTFNLTLYICYKCAIFTYLLYSGCLLIYSATAIDSPSFL